MSDVLLRGEAARPAWSGYWWPMLSGESRAGNRNLYDEDGPLDKYDAYCVAIGLPNPRAKEFEKWRYWSDTRMEQATGHTSYWWGHCNGWAAAAVLEPEPTAPRVAQGVQFAIGDLKGLLTVTHNGDPVDLIRKLGPSDAHLFHATVIQSIGIDRRGLIFDTKLDPIDPKTGQPMREVWNYPSYRYECDYQPAGEPETWDVTMRLWFADDGVFPDYVGTKNWPVEGQPKVYTYRIQGDQQNPSAGTWIGDSEKDHPDLMWRPQPLPVQNAAEDQDPGSSQTNFHPALRSLIYSIVAADGRAPRPVERQKLGGLDQSWIVTEAEAAAYPPPLSVGDFWRYRVAHRDTIDNWTRPFVAHIEVVGDQGEDWVLEVGAVHKPEDGSDIIPERHVIYVDKATWKLSERAPYPDGYAYTLRQDKVTRGFDRTDAPPLWASSPLRRLLTQMPYAWDRAGMEPVKGEAIKALGTKPVPARRLPVGEGQQVWADHTVTSPRGNVRGMFLVAQLEKVYAELLDYGHKLTT